MSTRSRYWRRQFHAIKSGTEAALSAAKLAGLRFRVGEIAAQALANSEWDGVAFVRDLNQALRDAEADHGSSRDVQPLTLRGNVGH
jgi:hypothetical protein